jgi:hypothetical protein
MKKTLSIVGFLLSLTLVCFGQRSKLKPYQLQDMGDTYVARITFDSVVYQEKCYCSFPKKGICQLFRGKVDKVYLAPEGTAFEKDQVRNVVYFTANTSFHIVPNVSYTVSLMPGSSGRYLVVNSVLNIDDPYHYDFLSPASFLSGYTSCYKLGFFTKLFIRVGLLKIGKVNAKTKKVRVDPFDLFLKNAERPPQFKG